MKLWGQTIAASALLFAGVGVLIAQIAHHRTAEILAADAAWLKAYETRDVSKAVAFMDERGSMLSPYTPIATGRDAVSKLMATEFAVRDMKLKWHADAAGLARSGELGYTSGSYDVSFTEAPGKAGSDKGKYLTLWRKQTDGSWKVLFDIYNSDLPPPAGN